MNTESELLYRIKTKPMELRELADWFEISPRRIADFVRSIPGAVEIGRRWRIPVAEMPPEYLIDVGLIAPQPAKLGQTLQGRD